MRYSGTWALVVGRWSLVVGLQSSVFVASRSWFSSYSCDLLFCRLEWSVIARGRAAMRSRKDPLFPQQHSHLPRQTATAQPGTALPKTTTANLALPQPGVRGSWTDPVATVRLADSNPACSKPLQFPHSWAIHPPP